MAKRQRSRRAQEAPPRLRAGPLVLRFAAGYAALGVVVYLVRESMTTIVGRAARDLLALADVAPRISAFVWTSGFALGVESPLVSGSLETAKGGWPFTLLFPLGTLLAVPGIAPVERLRRAVLIAIGGLALSAFLLAGSAAYGLGGALGAQGLVLYPPGRARAHFLIAFWAWSLYAIAYPAAASLYALAPALPALRAQFGVRRGPEAAPGPRARGPRAAPVWRRAAPFVLIVALAVAIDAASSRRIANGSLDELVAALEPINQDLGAYFVRAGRRELARGQTDPARRYFTIALRYPEHATQARAGLREVRTDADSAR